MSFDLQETKKKQIRLKIRKLGLELIFIERS